MKKILFLCTGNSCRSQMAEGFCKSMQSHQFDCYSAGVEAHGLNPYAVKVMSEKGIDITSHHSKLVSELDTTDFDIVVTVCESAANQCPEIFSNSRVIHRQFDDPPKLAKNAINEDEKLDCFRMVRDQISAWIKQLPQEFSQLEVPRLDISATELTPLES